MTRWLTVNQAADISGFSAYSIREWCKDGTITATQPRGTHTPWRIRPQDLQRFLEQPA